MTKSTTAIKPKAQATVTTGAASIERAAVVPASKPAMPQPHTMLKRSHFKSQRSADTHNATIRIGTTAFFVALPSPETIEEFMERCAAIDTGALRFIADKQAKGESIEDEESKAYSRGVEASTQAAYDEFLSPFVRGWADSDDESVPSFSAENLRDLEMPSKFELCEAIIHKARRGY